MLIFSDNVGRLILYSKLEGKDQFWEPEVFYLKAVVGLSPWLACIDTEWECSVH